MQTSNRFLLMDRAAQPERIELAPCPITRPAASLPPDEYEAMIERYAARAAARLPLFAKETT